MTTKPAPTEPPVYDPVRFAAWVVDTCLLFGTSLSTAYRVAAELLAGIERERKESPWAQSL